VIEITDLRMKYGEIEAVRGVRFTVACGEGFCLLGPNGAGKTTNVEILEGYRTRISSQVHVLGIDPASGARALGDQIWIVRSNGALGRSTSRSSPRSRVVTR
jgi:ABC-2 type transport system ATP-binding protein